MGFVWVNENKIVLLETEKYRNLICMFQIFQILFIIFFVFFNIMLMDTLLMTLL